MRARATAGCAGVAASVRFPSTGITIRMSTFGSIAEQGLQA
jgi:hypothetical protein